MKKAKRKHKRGFTLIELLAVIIILGILMIIAVPSVTEYIQTSRRNSYIVTAKSFIDAVTTKVNSLEYELMDVDATYYLPTKCVSFEKGGESPFGEFQESYVVVTYDGTKYDYYYTGRDSSNHGIVLTYRELLDESFILSNTKTLDLNVSVGSKKKIIKFTDECNKNSYEEIIPMQRIEEHGTLRDGSIEIATNEECFEFSNGKITKYICSEGDIVIPEYIRGEKVTTIGRYAFKFYNNSIYYEYGGTPIYTITIPKTVTTIENYAIESVYLYNIINKTGKAFDWDKIIEDNSEGDNYFEVGTYYALEYNSSAVHKFEITTEKVNYDLTNIFEPAGYGKVKIKNKGIYNINVSEYDWYNGWMLEEDLNNGDIIELDCKYKNVFVIDTNDNEIFASDLGYMCPV